MEIPSAFFIYNNRPYPLLKKIDEKLEQAHSDIQLKFTNVFCSLSFLLLPHIFHFALLQVSGEEIVKSETCTGWTNI
jgi:hypothetical protein